MPRDSWPFVFNEIREDLDMLEDAHFQQFPVDALRAAQCLQAHLTHIVSRLERDQQHAAAVLQVR